MTSDLDIEKRGTANHPPREGQGLATRSVSKVLVRSPSLSGGTIRRNEGAVSEPGLWVEGSIFLPIRGEGEHPVTPPPELEGRLEKKSLMVRRGKALPLHNPSTKPLRTLRGSIFLPIRGGSQLVIPPQIGRKSEPLKMWGGSQLWGGRLPNSPMSHAIAPCSPQRMRRRSVPRRRRSPTPRGPKRWKRLGWGGGRCEGLRKFEFK